jgi:hypothetical protein
MPGVVGTDFPWIYEEWDDIFSMMRNEICQSYGRWEEEELRKEAGRQRRSCSYDMFCRKV